MNLFVIPGYCNLSILHDLNRLVSCQSGTKGKKSGHIRAWDKIFTNFYKNGKKNFWTRLMVSPHCAVWVKIINFLVNKYRFKSYKKVIYGYRFVTGPSSEILLDLNWLFAFSVFSNLHFFNCNHNIVKK